MLQGIPAILGSKTGSLPYVQYNTYVPTGVANVHTIGITYPPKVGNLLVLIGTGDSTFSPISGWTKDATNVNNCETTVWSRVATGSETSVQVKLASVATCVLAIFEFPTITAIDKSSSSVEGLNSPTISCGTTASTTSANDIIIAIVSTDQFPAGNSPTGPVTAWTAGFNTLLWIRSTLNSPSINTEMSIALYKASSISTFTATATMTNLVSIVNGSQGLLVCYK